VCVCVCVCGLGLDNAAGLVEMRRLKITLSSVAQSTARFTATTTDSLARPWAPYNYMVGWSRV